MEGQATVRRDEEGVKGVEFQACETSAAIIKKARWTIQLPWKKQSEQEAIDFIKQPSQRDKRKLLANNRFRILLAKYPEPTDETAESDRLYGQKRVIDAARDNGWTGEHFAYFIETDTAGSAFIDGPGSLGFVAQTPRDDGLPFFAMSLSQRFTETCPYDADWEALVFVRPASLWDDTTKALRRTLFPHDNDNRPSDLMVLPVALLDRQVEQIAHKLDNMKKVLVSRDQSFVTAQVEKLKAAKGDLFALQKDTLLLRHRWKFASELVENLMAAFQGIAKRYARDDDDDGVPEYSPTLGAHVASQKAVLRSLIHELDTTASWIESQRNFADDQMRATIAYRDSTSLKIIGILTLFFLPATFIATVFSMGIFEWHAGQADEDPTVVSPWLGLYFGLSIIFTGSMFFVWKMMTKRAKRELAKKFECNLNP